MSATLEEVIEEAKALPPEQQEGYRQFLAVVFAFAFSRAAAETIKKTLSLPPDDVRRLRDTLDVMTWETLSPDARQRLASSIRGKYAHLPISSDDFAARKAEEIALEDRRSEQ